MRIMVVDAAPLIYQVSNTPMGKFCIQNGEHKGENTGLRYGFIRSVRSYTAAANVDKVVICWDTKAPVKKAEGVVGYKANRPWSEEREKMYAQVPGLKAMIGLTAWAQAEQDGYEADDIVGAFAKKFGAKGHHILVVTTDNDMMQLLQKNIMMFIPGKKAEKARIKTASDVAQEFGVWPNALVCWRAAAGDTSDNLKGVGYPKSVLDTFQNFLARIDQEEEVDSVQQKALEWVRSRGHGVGTEVYEKFTENLRVMNLHTPDEIQITKGTKDQAGLTALFEYCEFKSLMKFVPELCGEKSE